MGKKLADRMKAKGYVSAGEAAKRIGMTSKTVHGWVELGKVEGVTAADRLFVKWDSVLKHLGPDAAKLLGVHP